MRTAQSATIEQRPAVPVASVEREQRHCECGALELGFTCDERCPASNVTPMKDNGDLPGSYYEEGL